MQQLAREVLMEIENHEGYQLLEESFKTLIKEQIARLSETDNLTGASNRMKLQGLIEQEWARSVRYHAPTSIIKVDIVGLQRINEQYGYDVGDDVLLTIAHLIQGNIRQIDVLGRWGDDKFMVLVPTTNNEQASWLATKLKDLIESTLFMSVGKVTCKFGVADRDAAMDIEDWLRIVEVALRSAKENAETGVVDYESIAHLDI